MKYRVKCKRYSDGRGFFYPQYKYRFLPIWLSPMTSYTGYDHSPVSFCKEDDAWKWIENHKQRNLLTITTEYKQER